VSKKRSNCVVSEQNNCAASKKRSNCVVSEQNNCAVSKRRSDCSVSSERSSYAVSKRNNCAVSKRRSNCAVRERSNSAAIKKQKKQSDCASTAKSPNISSATLRGSAGSGKTNPSSLARFRQDNSRGRYSPTEGPSPFKRTIEIEARASLSSTGLPSVAPAWAMGTVRTPRGGTVELPTFIMNF